MGKKRPNVRVYLSDTEIKALLFLRNFSDFQGKKPAEILKHCMMIVAIDSKIRMDEKANEKNNSTDSTDTGSEVLPNSESGEEVSEESEKIQGTT